MIDTAGLEDLYDWMIDHHVLEVEVNGMRMRIAESAFEVEQVEDDAEDEERPAAPATHDGLRAAAAAARKKPLDA